MEVFWLPSSNRGAEGEGGYIEREEVLLIYMGDYSDWCSLSQIYVFKFKIFLADLF